MQQGGIPSHDTAPIMTNQKEFIVAQRLGNTTNISGKGANVVIRNMGWTAAPAVAALVGHRNAIARRNDGIDLMAPQVPALWASRGAESPMDQCLLLPCVM